MSDFIYTKVTFGGESIEVKTSKSTPDAQHEHTVAYFAALNELRHREAERVRPINDNAADGLDKPIKIYSRENPAGLTTGSDYMGNKRNWRPALPLQRWTAPKPNSDKQAAIAAAKIPAKVAAGKYVPVVWGGWPEKTDVTREMFMEEVN